MALSNRLLSHIAILILSILILPFAFIHAVVMSSNSTTIRPILMLYDLWFPSISILYISVQYVLASLWGTQVEMKATFGALALLILFGYGGIANNVVWIVCEFRRICPFDPPTQWINVYKYSIVKQVFAWMIVIVVFMHAGFVALQTRVANKEAQRRAKAGREMDFDEAKAASDITEVMKI
jgi:hypothetical protein